MVTGYHVYCILGTLGVVAGSFAGAFLGSRFGPPQRVIVEQVKVPETKGGDEMLNGMMKMIIRKLLSSGSNEEDEEEKFMNTLHD